MTPARITIDLPFATPTLNVTLRQHWRDRAKAARAMAWHVRVALDRQPRPAAPLQHALVSIERYSRRLPDYDGMVGGAKALIDILLHPGEPRLVKGKMVLLHPLGLGLIADDSPAHMRLTCKSLLGAPRTVVTIEESAPWPL